MTSHSITTRGKFVEKLMKEAKIQRNNYLMQRDALEGNVASLKNLGNLIRITLAFDLLWLIDPIPLLLFPKVKFRVE